MSFYNVCQIFHIYDRIRRVICMNNINNDEKPKLKVGPGEIAID